MRFGKARIKYVCKKKDEKNLKNASILKVHC